MYISDLELQMVLNVVSLWSFEKLYFVLSLILLDALGSSLRDAMEMAVPACRTSRQNDWLQGVHIKA